MIKNLIKKIPFIVKIFHSYKYFLQRKKIEKILQLKNNEKKFSKIYSTNFWGDNESFSGPGSNIKNTEDTIMNLTQIIKKYNVKSILDAPCGDFNWMQKVLIKFPYLKYYGMDIVSDVIKINNEKYSNSKIKFYKKDIIRNLFPEVDLVICRDFLIHLSNKDIKKFISNLKSSNFKYLLIHGFESNKKKIINKNISTGDYREINIFRNPINFSNKFSLKLEDHKNQNKISNYKSYLYLYKKKNLSKP